MDKKTRQFSIVSTIIFLILYFGYKHFKEESSNSKILGKWERKEVKGGNYIFNFFKNDSIKIQKDNSNLKMKYEVSENNLKLIDNGTIRNEYKYYIRNSKLTLIQNGDSLMFQKK